jgi:hypothetical protein
MNQGNPRPDFEKVDAAIAQGKLWRAKEILQGQIASFPYDSVLYEKYGAVLQMMRDLIESGKFLFLSGVRIPEYDEPIQIFLSRHGRTGWKSLKGSLPSPVRYLPLERFPTALQKDLQDLDHYEPLLPKPTHRKSIWLQRLFAFGIVIFIICGFIGLGTIIHFVVSWLK